MSGRSGVGRRTALLLTAHMHQLDIVTPHISRNYGLKQFKNDLKNVSLKEFQWTLYVYACMYFCHATTVAILTLNPLHVLNSIPYLRAHISLV